MATTLKNRQLTFNPPQGYLINGKISPTVASNNLTVALKTLAGNDPSASDPVYCRIGDTVRSITAALSVTKNAGTNWCNSGGAELATKEIDYFAVLSYNATDGILFGFCRIPATSGSDITTLSSTSEKYLAASASSAISSSDPFEVVGRFAATLSAGAGYTWTVPTYTATNLIQRPIYETRWLTWVPTLAVSGGTAPTYTAAFQNKYYIKGRQLEFQCGWDNSSGGVAGSGTNGITVTLPMSYSGYTTQYRHCVGYGYSGESGGTNANVTDFLYAANQFGMYADGALGILGNDQSSTARFIWNNGQYEI